MFSSAVDETPSDETTGGVCIVGGAPISTTTDDDDDDDDDDGCNHRRQSPIPTGQSSSSFRLYYNDVYEVTLPPKHRFPMKKYQLVRKRVQQAIVELDDEQGSSGVLDDEDVQSTYGTGVAVIDDDDDNELWLKLCATLHFHRIVRY